MILLKIWYLYLVEPIMYLSTRIIEHGVDQATRVGMRAHVMMECGVRHAARS